MAVLALAFVFSATTIRAAEPTSRPEASLTIDLGWGGLYRPGEWAPLYLTLSGVDMPSEGVAEVRAFQDSRETVILTADVPLQQGRARFVLPIMMGTIDEGASVTIRDKATGRPIANARVGDIPAAGRMAVGTRGTGAGTAARLTVVAGGTAAVGPGDLIGVDAAFPTLPSVPELYESVDLLVLNNSTLAELSAEQVDAILAWTRAGGRTMVCVPPEGLQPNSPLEPCLPAAAGDLHAYPAGAGRALSPRAGSASVSLADGATGAYVNLGLGRIYELPYPLTLASRAEAGKLLGPFRPRLAVEDPKVGDLPAPWSRDIGLALLVIGLLLGPTEAVVRRAHDAWPWRWWVTGGVLLAVGGATLATASSAPSLHVRTLRLVDQTASEQVAVTTWSAALPDASAEPAMLRVVNPLHLKTTRHVAIGMRLADGRLRLASPCPTGALISTRLATAPAEVGVQSWDGQTLRLSADVDWASLETATGKQGVRREADRWIADPNIDATAGAGADFEIVRKLTPTRSGQLQARVAAGEGAVLWTRRGDSYARTFLPAPASSRP